jgi:hypothetical protein
LLGMRSLALDGWVHVCAAVLCLVALDSSVHAAWSLEARKLPMKFSWISDNHSWTCEPQCKGWVAATGIVTSDTYRQFEEFSKTYDLRGATVVLDSGGGSVLDAIKLGRRWRELRMSTTVGAVVETALDITNPLRTSVRRDAYCESMCVFLLLAGVNRHVPPTAHIRVHQIWMADRAEDAEAATYTARDVTIIERDVGRLARYTFEMGGTGNLLELALSVPPWKPLRELTLEEIRNSNLTSVETMAEILPGVDSAPMISKPVQERFAAEPQKTAEIKARVQTVNAKSE